MNLYKRIIPIFAVIAICTSLFCSPVYASNLPAVTPTPALPALTISPSYPSSGGGYPINLTTDLADWMFRKGVQAGHFIADSFGFLNAECPMSENTGGTHKWVDSIKEVDHTAMHCYVCEWCGEWAVDLFHNEYADNVQELPVTAIDSEGGLIWVPSFRYLSVFDSGYYHVNYGPAADPNDVRFSSSISYDFEFSNGSPVVHLSASSSNSSGYFYLSQVLASFEYQAPITGIYYPHYDLRHRVVGRTVDGPFDSSFSLSDSSNNRPVDQERFFQAGADVQLYPNSWNGDAWSPSTSTKYFYLTVTFNFPSYRIIPETGLVDLNNDATYNTNSRAGSITGDYGILGDNNEIVKADTTYIVNEDDNSVYNPVTNTTTSYDKYTYDYSDRSYTFSNDSGDTTTVTYGDENITIKEGDTTYNVYYIYQNETEPSPTPAAGGHTHHYTSTVTKEATCTLAGSERFVCDICGDAYNKTIPALGHNWEVKSQVPTTYNEDGSLATQGYTIYRCSRCGEEYKADDGTSPPDVVSPGGDLVDSSALEEFRQKLVSFFSAVPQMFGDLSDFLAAGWSYIPDEITWFITFGFGMAVLLALWKLFWR